MIHVVRTTDEMAKAVIGSTCYLSGPITGNKEYKKDFANAEQALTYGGMHVINPAYMPEGLGYDDYFPTCYAQIAVSNVICFLFGYDKSTGASREAKRAQMNKKEYWAFTLEQYYLYCDYNEFCFEMESTPEADKEAKKKLAGWIRTAKDGIRIAGKLLEEWIRKVNPPKTQRQKANDEVKRMRRSYLYCLQQIDANSNEIDRLDSRRKRITVQYNEVHGGSGGDYPETVIDNIRELEDEILEKTGELDAERRKVMDWIGKLADYRERSVLGLCYLNGLQFEEIAKKLNYDHAYVRKLHGRAIDKLREMMAEAAEKPKK